MFASCLLAVFREITHAPLAARQRTVRLARRAAAIARPLVCFTRWLARSAALRRPPCQSTGSRLWGKLCRRRARSAHRFVLGTDASPSRTCTPTTPTNNAPPAHECASVFYVTDGAGRSVRVCSRPPRFLPECCFARRVLLARTVRPLLRAVPLRTWHHLLSSPKMDFVTSIRHDRENSKCKSPTS